MYEYSIIYSFLKELHKLRFANLDCPDCAQKSFICVINQLVLVENSQLFCMQ